MNKQFLVTISNDNENLYGVKFLHSFFKKQSEHKVTLLHIYRKDASNMNANLLEMWEKPDDAINGYLTIGARIAIDKSISLLSESKMAVDQVVTKTVAEQYGKVSDILFEGEKGLYDAIILGKRASYTLQWLFERPADEVAQSIIKDSQFTTPIWICPENSSDRKDVLVCVDGSENSLRAVDHVGFILANQEQHNITLFHVKSSSGIPGHKIFPAAEKILHNHGVSDNRIQTVSTWGLSTTGTIQGIIDRHKYAAVAIGLRGSKEATLKERNLAGTTASALINKIEKCPIWCCP